MIAYKIGPVLLQKFTPEERDCISAKIREIKEKGLRGKPASAAQAVAVAIKTCAPGKSTAKAASARGFDALGAPLLHAFPAERQANGRWTIRGIPIFSATFDDRDGDAVEFDAEWLRQAVEMHQAREAGGHLYPAHVEHHVPGRPDIQRELAGYFSGVRLGQWRDPALGADLPTIFADLVEVEDAVFQKIQGLRLPYRSVEILDPETPDVDSLALMSSEVPYFRYPITVARVVAMGARLDTPLPAARVALVGDVAPRGRRFLFAYQVNQMPDPKKMQDEPAANPPAPAGGGDQGEVLGLLKEIKEMLAGLLGGEETGAPEPMVPMAAGTGDVETVTMEAAKENAKLFARLQATEAKIAGIEQDRSLDARIQAWKDKRLAFDEKSVRDAARGFAAKGALVEYLGELEKHLPQAPPTGATGTTGAAPTEEKDPVLAAYKDWPDWVRAFAAERLQAWKSSDLLQAMPSEQFVRTQLNAELRRSYAREPARRKELDTLKRRFAQANGAGGR